MPGRKHRGRANKTEFVAPVNSQTQTRPPVSVSTGYTADIALGPEKSHENERKTPDQPPPKYNKRKRSLSADTDMSTVQILDSTLEQPPEVSYPAKRQRSRSVIRSDSVSLHVSPRRSLLCYRCIMVQRRRRQNVRNNERPERYSGKRCRRDIVNEVRYSSSFSGHDDSDDDGEFDGDGNREDEEGDSEDNGSLTRANDACYLQTLFLISTRPQ